MGLNVAAVHLRGKGVGDLGTLGLRAGSRSTSVDLAINGHEPIAMEHEDGLFILDPTFELLTQPGQFASALGGRSVWAALGSTADSYSVEVYDGPELRRHVVDSPDGRVIDQGEPLAEESGVDVLDEDTTCDIFAALTGVQINGAVVD